MAYFLSAELRGHGGPIRALSIGPLGELISGAQDALVKRWVDGTEISTHSEHGHWVVSICACDAQTCARFKELGTMSASHQQGIFVTGSLDNLIRVYSASGEVICTLEGHAKGVVSLAFTADGYLVSGSWDGTARVWDLSSGACVSVLEGHENGVSVCPLENGIIATTSTGEQVNNTVTNYKLRFWNWREGICIREIMDHKGAVRCVSALPLLSEGNRANAQWLVTSSNDGTVKLRTTDGTCVETFAHPVGADGQAPFVLHTQALAAPDSFVSAGEDGNVCVWEGNALRQTIPHPSSVWCVCALPNGDFATGGHDDVIRIWTRDPSRMASEDKQQEYTALVTAENEKKRKGPSSDEIAKLPRWEARGTKRGKSEGFVQMFNKQGEAIAAQWSAVSQTWIEIGTVTGMLNTGSVNGVQYDHVFDVEVESATGLLNLKIGYNNGENPFVAAQRFIDDNMLPQTYLAQIADWIIQRAQTAPPMLGMNDSVVASQAATPMAVEAPRAQPLPRHFPPAAYTTFAEVGNADKILQKIQEFDSIATVGKLSGEDFTHLQTVLQTLNNTSYWHSSTISTAQLSPILKMILDWPLDNIFPALDVLRFVLCHPNGSSSFVSTHKCGEVYSRCVEALRLDSSQVAPVLCALRVFVNAFKHSAARQTVTQGLGDVIDACAQHISAPNSSKRKTLGTAIAALLQNISKLAQTSYETLGDVPAQLVSLCVEALGSDCEPSVIFACACVLGTLCLLNQSNKELARQLDALEVIENLTKRSAGSPQLSEALEDLQRLLS